jgi:hypothetical protein
MGKQYVPVLDKFQFQQPVSTILLEAFNETGAKGARRLILTTPETNYIGKAAVAEGVAHSQQITCNVGANVFEVDALIGYHITLYVPTPDIMGLSVKPPVPYSFTITDNDTTKITIDASDYFAEYGVDVPVGTYPYQIAQVGVLTLNGTATLTDVKATWSDDQYNTGYYVVITDAEGKQHSYDITDTVATNGGDANLTFTIADGLIAGTYEYEICVPDGGVLNKIQWFTALNTPIYVAPKNGMMVWVADEQTFYVYYAQITGALNGMWVKQALFTQALKDTYDAAVAAAATALANANLALAAVPVYSSDLECIIYTDLVDEDA